MELKSSKNYEQSISYFKQSIDKGNLSKYKSQAILEIAIINEMIGKDEEAIKYYNKYIVAYANYNDLYDDALYNLGMLYYENDDLDNAKKIFYILKSDAPDSMYYNSKVKEILSM